MDINYNDLIPAMKAGGITGYSIKKGHEKENLINQYTYTQITKNGGFISLEVLVKLLEELNINEVRLVKDDGDTFKLVIPTKEEV